MAYAMTNSASCNEVIAFRRGKSGKLSRIDAFRTGGRGTGTAEVSNATPRDGVDPLASQGSLVLSRNGCLLFAVNAGSNSVSSFRVKRDGRLVLVDVDPSGGTQPNSLAVFGDLLYVANVGDAANNYNSNAFECAQMEVWLRFRAQRASSVPSVLNQPVWYSALTADSWS